MVLKPHTVEVRKSVNNDESSPTTIVIEGIRYGEIFNINGQLTPISASAAFEKFQVNVSRPHLFMWDDEGFASMQEAAGQFPIGSLLEYANQKYRVVSAVQVFDINNEARNNTCVVEQLQYAIDN